jgi:glycosyltransferase involved in cell wall biosynthesis
MADAGSPLEGRYFGRSADRNACATAEPFETNTRLAPFPAQEIPAALTVIIPYFNEEGWIGKTIDSLAAQTLIDFNLVLVDNASSDGGSVEACVHADALAGVVTHLYEPLPGKTNALAAGLEGVETPLVAVCDADTIYPPNYLRQILELFDRNSDAVAVMAVGLYDPANSPAARRRIRKVLDKSRRHPGKCHTGGYAQAFRTDALRCAGGFDAKSWPYVLEDHEVAFRVMRSGTAVYAEDHYCFPSTRRTCRKAMDWTRFERLLYRCVPPRRLDWFFYDFLAPRLARRNSLAVVQRRRCWKTTPDEPWTIDDPTNPRASRSGALSG